MFDDLNAYLNENVWEAYQAFLDFRQSRAAGKSKDLRLAITAATTLYHLREHIPQPQRKTRRELTKICPDYGLLGDVVNATKHGHLTRGNPLVVNAEDIYELHTATMYQDELGEYWHGEKSVYAKLQDGSERDLYEVLTSVLNMWLSELHRIGAIPYTDPKPIEKSVCVPPRSSQAGSVPLDLEIIQGVRFTHRSRLQRYNYDTGQIEPFDLAGGQVKFRIYRPEELVVCLKNHRTGKEIVNVIPLTKEETEQVMHMTQEERSAFVVDMIGKHGIDPRQTSESGLGDAHCVPFVSGTAVVEPRQL